MHEDDTWGMSIAKLARYPISSKSPPFSVSVSIAENMCEWVVEPSGHETYYEKPVRDVRTKGAVGFLMGAKGGDVSHHHGK